MPVSTGSRSRTASGEPSSTSSPSRRVSRYWSPTPSLSRRSTSAVQAPSSSPSRSALYQYETRVERLSPRQVAKRLGRGDGVVLVVPVGAASGSASVGVPAVPRPGRGRGATVPLAVRVFMTGLPPVLVALLALVLVAG